MEPSAVGTRANFNNMSLAGQRTHLTTQLPRVARELGQLYGHVIQNVPPTHRAAKDIVDHRNTLDGLRDMFINNTVEDDDLPAAFFIVSAASSLHRHLRVLPIAAHNDNAEGSTSEDSDH